MLKAADELNFEAAAKLRDRIKALDACRQTQKVVGAPGEEKDVIAYYSDDFCTAISIFFVRDGGITDSETEVFPSEQLVQSSDIVSFLCDFYLKREFIPEEITLDFPLTDEETEDLREFLETECKAKCHVRFPERGNAKQLCQMVRENAKEIASKHKNAKEKQDEIAIRLAQLLCLEVVPELIEAYDISNMGADNITAGKISIKDGKFNKSAYRTYKIRTTETPDDSTSMREAISRRLAHTEDTHPDLILLDGGKGHDSVIRELMRENGYNIPVFGMVKDEFHKTRALTDDNGEISISKETALFNFIYKIQEEVHRYTFGAMEKAKRKSVKRSSLTEINGIGPSKAKALMTHFKSISAIKNASRNEIATVKGMNARDVDTIYMHFHKDEIGEQ
jgi:excinuclease ABC subunit C